MSQDEFTKLFTHMNKRFDAVDKKCELVHKDIDNLRGAVDAYAKQVETFIRKCWR